MSKAAVYTFREVVNDDADIQEELRASGDLIAVAAGHGFKFTMDDVRAVMEELGDELYDFERELSRNMR